MTQRITVTLPDGIAKKVRRESKDTRRPVSQLIAEALRQRDDAEHKRRLAEAYTTIREEARATAKEWSTDVAENWPRD